MAIPKSVHRERIFENIDVYDFSLSREDMDQISALETGYQREAMKKNTVSTKSVRIQFISRSAEIPYRKAAARIKERSFYEKTGVLF